MNLGTGTNCGFHLEQSDDGVTLVATGPWTAQAEQVLDDGDADGLDLNYAKGFKDTDLRFIRGWPVRRVKILARTIKDLSPLYRLAGTLESLSVVTSPSAVVDVAQLPSLNGLAADWAQVRQSIGQAPGLRDLFLLSYSEDDLEPLRRNSQLERLQFKDRPRIQSLGGLTALSSIRHLGIYLATRLKSIDALGELEPCLLDEFHLAACRRIVDLSPVSCARSLRMLEVSDCGDIESLRPLKDLERLEVLWLFGTTEVIDGDLSPIAGLPRLRELRMQERRSYSPPTAQVKASISDRESRKGRMR